MVCDAILHQRRAGKEKKTTTGRSCRKKPEPKSEQPVAETSTEESTEE